MHFAEAKCIRHRAKHDADGANRKFATYYEGVSRSERPRRDLNPDLKLRKLAFYPSYTTRARDDKRLNPY